MTSCSLAVLAQTPEYKPRGVYINNPFHPDECESADAESARQLRQNPGSRVWQPVSPENIGTLASRTLLSIVVRVSVFYLTARWLFSGYYDPTPAWDHLRTALEYAPWCFGPLAIIGAAASATETSFRGFRVVTALRVPRLVLVVGLGGALFAALLAAATILAGPAREPAVSRVACGTAFATWVLAAVFPVH